MTDAAQPQDQATATVVYRIVLPDGQEHAWHGTVEALRTAYPKARVTGELQLDASGKGVWLAYEGSDAEPPSYEAMTAEQLKTAAAARGVEVPAKATKADLVALLNAADGAAPTPAPAPAAAAPAAPAEPAAEANA
jgi:hypothetical protein